MEILIKYFFFKKLLKILKELLDSIIFLIAFNDNSQIF